MCGLARLGGQRLVVERLRGVGVERQRELQEFNDLRDALAYEEAEALNVGVNVDVDVDVDVDVERSAGVQ